MNKVGNVLTGKRNSGFPGRIISMAVGGLLAATGIHFFKKDGWSLFIPGSILLYRGVSGFCPVNNALYIDTARKKTF